MLIRRNRIDKGRYQARVRDLGRARELDDVLRYYLTRDLDVDRFLDLDRERERARAAALMPSDIRWLMTMAAARARDRSLPVELADELVDGLLRYRSAIEILAAYLTRAADRCRTSRYGHYFADLDLAGDAARAQELLAVVERLLAEYLPDATGGVTGRGARQHGVERATGIEPA